MLITTTEAANLVLKDIVLNGSTKKLKSITNLLETHGCGNNMVVFGPDLCRVIEGSPRFSEVQKAVAAKMRLKYSEYSELTNLLNYYIEIDIDVDAPKKVGPVWRVSVGWFETNQPKLPYLICEDLYDCDIVVHAAHDYLNINKLNKINMRLTPINGGGVNTSRSIERHLADGCSYCISIVDSDRSSPGINSKYGATADLCLSIGACGVYELHVTTGRELENHIPLMLIDHVSRFHVENNGSAGAINPCGVGDIDKLIYCYADLKSGIRAFDVEKMEAVDKDFWLKFFGGKNCERKNFVSCSAKKSGDCCSEFIGPVGRILLKTTVDFLNKNSDPRRTRMYSGSFNFSEWIDIGSKVASFGVCPKISDV